MKKERDYKINRLLDSNTSIDMSDFEFMNKQIKEIGRDGMLHFIIKNHKEGWLAQCEEVPGIVTGNTNPNPDQEEINSHIRQAIFTAFNVNIKTLKRSMQGTENLVRIEQTIDLCLK